jgi:hypothetical protein
METNMTTATIPGNSFPRKTFHEFKVFAVIFVYLYLTLGMIIMMKAAILHTRGIDFSPFGIAAIKAAILAKFMLLGHSLKLGERPNEGPLIWPTLYGAVTFLALLVFMTIIEEVIVGSLHGRSIASSLGELTGSHLAETVASIGIILLVLIPYFAFRVPAGALGNDHLLQMFFGTFVPRVMR